MGLGRLKTWLAHGLWHRAAVRRAPRATTPQVRRITLPLKTMLGLIVLLSAAVGVCGLTCMNVTKSMLQEIKQAQLQHFAYGLAGLLGRDDPRPTPEELSRQLAVLAQVRDLDFAVVTDPSMHIMGAHFNNADYWRKYQASRQASGRSAQVRLGAVQTFDDPTDSWQSIAVPIFAAPNPATSAQASSVARPALVGYLHLGSSSALVDGRLGYLQATILLTCMIVVALCLPLTYIVARHITVPIQRLAEAARAMARGGTWAAVEIQRSDEIAELAGAFNTMAHTLLEQQENIRQANASLEEKVQERTIELETLNRRLQAEMAEKEDFLRAVSHDLNGPLRNISGMASMLLLKYRQSMESDALQRLERIQKNVEIECGLINELLELSRIKSRREKIEEVNLHELMQSVADQFSNDLETRNITLSMPQPLPVMHCEKSRFRQVFQNLLDNAIKYMKAEGQKRITVESRLGDREVIISVTDTGMGIAPEDLPHLFHVFRRAKNTANIKIPGKGVGLASVKSIIENYHGRIWIESSPGVGSTFHIALPQSCFVSQDQEVAV